MRTTRGPWLLAVAAGVLALAAAFVLAARLPGDAPIVSWLAIAGSATAMAGALAAGAIRGGRLSRWALVAVSVVLLVPLVGFGLALSLPPESVEAPLVLGLPLRAAIVLLGVGFVPVIVLPACYALDFRDREGE